MDEDMDMGRYHANVDMVSLRLARLAGKELAWGF